jgi:hypothetical protein
MCRMIARSSHRSLAHYHATGGPWIMLRSIRPRRGAVRLLGFVPEVEALSGGATDQTDKQNASRAPLQ